jgi:hypothetical protein
MSNADKYRLESKRADEKAAVTTGPFRELLLCIAEAYALLARLEDELFPSPAADKIEAMVSKESV